MASDADFRERGKMARARGGDQELLGENAPLARVRNCVVRQTLLSTRGPGKVRSDAPKDLLAPVRFGAISRNFSSCWVSKI